MALGFAAATGNAILDGFGNNTAYTGEAAIYMQLHTAAPGAAGTTSIATETTRKSVSFGAAATVSSVSTMKNDAAITWTSVAGSETYTHFSLWSASTSGTFLGSGTVTANAVTAGDTFTIAIAGLVVTVSTAA